MWLAIPIDLPKIYCFHDRRRQPQIPAVELTGSFVIAKISDWDQSERHYNDKHQIHQNRTLPKWWLDTFFSSRNTFEQNYAYNMYECVWRKKNWKQLSWKSTHYFALDSIAFEVACKNTLVNSRNGKLNADSLRFCRNKNVIFSFVLNFFPTINTNPWLFLVPLGANEFKSAWKKQFVQLKNSYPKPLTA